MPNYLSDDYDRESSRTHPRTIHSAPDHEAFPIRQAVESLGSLLVKANPDATKVKSINLTYHDDGGMTARVVKETRLFVPPL